MATCRIPKVSKEYRMDIFHEDIQYGSVISGNTLYS